MADDNGTVHTVSDGGVAGDFHPVDPFRILVGPSTAAEFNTIRLPLVAIACWRVDDMRFAFDSSFVNADPAELDNPNDIRSELRHLVKLRARHPGAPLTVFGHADPVGSDDYNKLLSGRRAMAIYALLICHTDPAKAVSMWQKIAATESWGSDQRQQMLDFTGLPAGTVGAPLIQAYQQKLAPPALLLTATDFLGKGADPGGKADFQGCSEFNPLLIFSQEKEARFAEAKQQQASGKGDDAQIDERNVDNAPNRRVMVLLFRPGTRVDPGKWPCPRATEGTSGCKLRFFSDGEKRRSTHLPGDVDRFYEKTKDTFACRFYQRLSSPCESIVLRAVGFWDAPDVEPIPADIGEMEPEASQGTVEAHFADGDPASAEGRNSFTTDFLEGPGIG